VVLEAVGNADNVGAVFRNAAAFGAGAVLFGPDCADPLYRKAIRTSMGAALQLPFAHFSDWPADLNRLREVGMATIALTPNPDALPLADVALTPVARGSVALLLGHEGSGLTAEALRATDMQARIPIAPGVDSLNVATAAAIALYELGRLRA
jgi:tRNA G18 (ribose-2'-O)-methylase SpoU